MIFNKTGWSVLRDFKASRHDLESLNMGPSLQKAALFSPRRRLLFPGILEVLVRAVMSLGVFLGEKSGLKTVLESWGGLLS